MKEVKEQWPLDLLQDSFRLWWRSTVAFYEAVDWSEWWIQSIVAFHVATFVLILLTQGRQRVHIALVGLLCVAGLSLQWVNELGAQHWRSFASQPYFDKNGLFLGTMVGMPILVNLLFLLVRALCDRACRPHSSRSRHCN